MLIRSLIAALALTSTAAYAASDTVPLETLETCEIQGHQTFQGDVQILCEGDLSFAPGASLSGGEIQLFVSGTITYGQSSQIIAQERFFATSLQATGELQVIGGDIQIELAGTPEFSYHFQPGARRMASLTINGSTRILVGEMLNASL